MIWSITLFFHIFSVSCSLRWLKKNKPPSVSTSQSDLLKKLEPMAKKIEKVLFESSKSLEEYGDPSTIGTRLKNVAVFMQMQRTGRRNIHSRPAPKVEQMEWSFFDASSYKVFLPRHIPDMLKFIRACKWRQPINLILSIFGKRQHPTILHLFQSFLWEPHFYPRSYKEHVHPELKSLFANIDIKFLWHLWLPVIRLNYPFFNSVGANQR